jgi:RNA 3'-terminal phosphate cyclase (ATP)
MAAALEIDGAHGEGGGQIVRSALSLAALLGRPIRITNIRAGRPHPGLAAQHVTAVRAVAALCAAELAGDEIGATRLDFRPRALPRAGSYRFDVAEARVGGSAGSVTLLLQALLPPLLGPRGASRLHLAGGTHVAWSPPVDYLQEVWLPALARMGVQAEIALQRWGWYPAGGGAIDVRIGGHALCEGGRLAPLDLVARGPLERVTGRAVAANLMAHIPQRMADRARALLDGQGIPCEIAPLRVRAVCPGAGLFLTAHYGSVRAGFAALGEPGKPAELVAEEAVTALLAHQASGAAVDIHLADQVLLPMAFAAGPSRFGVARVSRHLATHAWLLERFGIAAVAIEGGEAGATVTVTPRPVR